MGSNVYQTWGSRLSAENQLLAEERWLVDALVQIKNQRNCLQIERLHLESLKAAFKKTPVNKKAPDLSASDQEASSTLAVHMMQNVTKKKEDKMSEEFNNQEELNLMVSSNPLLIDTIIDNDCNMEEDEEEESEDDLILEMMMHEAYKGNDLDQ